MENKNITKEELSEAIGALMAIAMIEDFLTGIEDMFNAESKEEAPKEEDSVFEVDFGGGMKFKGNREDYKTFISSLPVLQDLGKQTK